MARDLDWGNYAADGEAASDGPEGKFTTLDQAMEAFAVAMKDVLDDNPDGAVDADNYAFDIIKGIAQDCEEKIGRELCRTQLGFVPDSLRWEE